MFISIPILILRKRKVTISENCAIGSGSRLFTGSVNIFTPKSRPLLNTMIEVENEDDYNSGEITMKYNSLILTNCVVSPKNNYGRGVFASFKLIFNEINRKIFNIFGNTS